MGEGVQSRSKGERTEGLAAMRRVQQGRTADRAGHGANPQACSVSFSCVCLPGGEAADFRGSAESPGSNLTHSHTKVCHGQNWTLS